jgi:hypothetical protein
MKLNSCVNYENIHHGTSILPPLTLLVMIFMNTNETPQDGGCVAVTRESPREGVERQK